MTVKQTGSSGSSRNNSEEKAEKVCELVTGALERRRQVMVYELAKLFFERLPTEARSEADGENDGWIMVESLSQLRTFVGGRFQNLKQKWVEAGLPLREHRGDRKVAGEVNQVGWVELSLWIARQGYEAKLASSEEDGLFMIRKV